MLSVSKKSISLTEDPNAADIGFATDCAYAIQMDSRRIGRVVISFMLDDSIHIEWVEIDAPYRGSGCFRHVLLALMDRFEADKLHLETSEENKPIYEHLRAVELSYDDFREVSEMEIRRDSLMIP